ncbi:replication protein RepA [Actinoplanes sp. URMC 104]|uniref:replication protein RepA n=1 Tax=Actinoplanes sp. URMC 104 TaxID=3423409 RepID=UPI003F1A990C
MPKPPSELELVEAVAAMDERLNPLIGYMPFEFVQCAFPQRKPLDDATRKVFLRRNNGLSLKMVAGTNEDNTNIGVPYGPKTRLALAAWCRGIKLHGKFVSMGPSMAQWLTEDLGFTSATGGKNGNKPAVGEQVRRLIHANIEVIPHTDKLRHRGGGLRIIEDWDVWWDTRRPNPTTKRPTQHSFVVFTDRFVRLVKDATPVHMETMVRLGQSALAQDIYSFLAAKLPNLEAPFKLNWIQAAIQFGNGPMPEDPAEQSGFISETKRNILTQLPKVMREYHEANVSLADDDSGLWLKRSPAHVPQRGAWELTRDRRRKTVEQRRMEAAAADRLAAGVTGRRAKQKQKGQLALFG